MYYLCMCILIFLAIVGVCAICRGISGLMYRSDSSQLVVLDPMSGRREDAEFVLRNAVRRVRFYGTASRVICVDSGMDSETRRVCELVSADYPFVSICTREQLADIVKNL